MKKSIYALFTILLMGTFSVNVAAATEYTFDGWTTSDGYYGTATEVSGNVTNLKGSTDAIGGMYLGPFNKEGAELALADGIKEQTNVELNFDTMDVSEYFEVSLALKNGAGSYVSEAVVMTQRISESQIKLTTGWDKDFETVVTESGVYTYQWEMFIEEGKTYVIFTLLNDGEIVATTGKVDFDTIITADTLNPIAEQEDVTVKYLWFCNINVAKGVNVYTNLPTITVDEEIDEEVANVIVDSLKNDSILKNVVETEDVNISLVVAPIEEVPEELEEKFGKIVKYSVVLDYFDISILVETANDEYLLTALGEEINFDMALPTDLPEVAKGKVRKFFILRQHKNDIEELDATLSKDGKTISFTSDRFSTYALAYVDEELPPQTGDNVILYAVLGLVTLVGFGFAISRVKKQFN